MPTLRYDLREIHRTIELLLQPGQVYELRIPNTRQATVRGYFDVYAKLGQAAANMSGKAPAVYLLLNPANPDLLARAANRLAEYAQETTADKDILTRRWLPIDLDAVRPAGISSTEEEHQQALARAQECMEWLTLQGWPAPISADSGNGAHLVSRVDLPNDEDATSLLRDCLQALSFRFDDEKVKVDTGNYNASRIWKLYGTLVCKGDSIPERPHRLARTLEAPERPEVVPLPCLQALAAQVPKPPPAPARRAYRGNGEPLNLEAWIAQHGIPIHHQKTWNGGNVWVLARCIWNPEHTDKAPYIIQFSNGAIAAGCHHNGCQGKGWAELREAVEPGYRERRQSPNVGVRWLAGQWVRGV
jgi:hypothetical protein